MGIAFWVAACLTVIAALAYSLRRVVSERDCAKENSDHYRRLYLAACDDAARLRCEAETYGSRLAEIHKLVK
jgi:hypothetical protein